MSVHLFKLNLIFISAESPTPHPPDNTRDVLDVSDSEKLLNMKKEPGNQPF